MKETVAINNIFSYQEVTSGYKGLRFLMSRSAGNYKSLISGCYAANPFLSTMFADTKLSPQALYLGNLAAAMYVLVAFNDWPKLLMMVILPVSTA